VLDRFGLSATTHNTVCVYIMILLRLCTRYHAFGPEKKKKKRRPSPAKQWRVETRNDRYWISCFSSNANFALYLDTNGINCQSLGSFGETHPYVLAISRRYHSVRLVFNHRIYNRLSFLSETGTLYVSSIGFTLIRIRHIDVVRSFSISLLSVKYVCSSHSSTHRSRVYTNTHPHTHKSYSTSATTLF